jgi:sigma-B regulation protein RsbU (phosphoserine phosphatase)
MTQQNDLIVQLKTLNQIAETLNRGVDVHGAMNTALAHLVELMGLETGWIFLRDPSSEDKGWGYGYTLIAHHNLPPALDLDNYRAWYGGCDCQGLCNKGKLNEAYNEVRCTRLAEVHGDRRDLSVHASAPLMMQGQVLGILNVAASTWEVFSPESLALLNNVGSMMAATLERARLFDILRERRIDEQAALVAFSNQLLGQLNLQDLMDYLVAEVCRLLQVDACALLLTTDDPDELIFRAVRGWSNPKAVTGRHVPSGEGSGPGRVMMTHDPILIEDLQTNTITPEWVRAEGFRGHAIMPLIADNKTIGTLIIDSFTLRQWSEDDVRFLSLMANQAAIAIEKARLHETEIQNQRLERELAIGQQIQLSLLPEACPTRDGWDFAAYYKAARVVGGDFYDYFELSDDKVGVVIADVADKGVPAALFMALSRTIIRTVARDGHSPTKTLLRSNQLILDDNNSEIFLTAGYATLDLNNGNMCYANAGHNPPLWYQASTMTIQPINPRGIILGIFPTIVVEQQEISLSSGDVVVFYTDGITEAMDGYGDLFDDDRLQKIIFTHAHYNANELIQAIVEGICDFVDDTPQSDDMTLFVVKRL